MPANITEFFRCSEIVLFQFHNLVQEMVSVAMMMREQTIRQIR